ncbi:MAG: D-alanyl-D-alanine carboxypeptidase/D-alanyl-D-alanine-endopeptidase [Fimbriimonadaceae bacterium]|nr:D-alanyl-D-alanine carboxypeptidase/D-alanyl-D-alanine-endopeptidase [Fimbriimonadaceae bacterium]
MLGAFLSLLVPQNPIDDLLDVPATRGSVIAACILRENGEPLYTRNPDQRMVPASNQKLLTCAFALDVLGPDWRPVTKFWKIGSRIVIDAQGDPTFTLAQLREAAKKLGKASVVEVHQAFRPLIPPSWEYDDLPNRYAAPITALTVDKGSFELWASGGRLTPLPPEFGVRTSVGPSKPGEPRVTYDPLTGKILVRGPLPMTKTRLDTLALARPDLAAARVLGKQVRTVGSVPKTAPTLTLVGPPLKEIVAECLTDSINLYAEHLLLLAARKLDPNLSVTRPYERATQLMRDHLAKELSLDREALRPDDGSGLSRHNFVTTRTLCRLLQWSKTKPWGADFEAGMVRGGKGTLAKRLEASSFVGKTGTLDAVVSLTGWVREPSGQTLTMSVILNHGISSSQDQRAVLDQLARFLESPPGGLQSLNIRTIISPYGDGGSHARAEP